MAITWTDSQMRNAKGIVRFGRRVAGSTYADYVAVNRNGHVTIYDLRTRNYNKGYGWSAYKEVHHYTVKS